MTTYTRLVELNKAGEIVSEEQVSVSTLGSKDVAKFSCQGLAPEIFSRQLWNDRGNVRGVLNMRQLDGSVFAYHC